MQNVLLVVQLLIAVALIGVILIQRTAQDGGGLTGGGNTMGGLFTARGSANLLTRATAVLAFLFIANCLVLGAIASHQHASGGSLVDQIPATTQQTAPAEPAEAPTPAAPEVPLAK
jgi:preprotein translocase subunit SecG